MKRFCVVAATDPHMIPWKISLRTFVSLFYHEDNQLRLSTSAIPSSLLIKLRAARLLQLTYDDQYLLCLSLSPFSSSCHSIFFNALNITLISSWYRIWCSKENNRSGNGYCYISWLADHWTYCLRLYKFGVRVTISNFLPPNIFCLMLAFMIPAMFLWLLR